MKKIICFVLCMTMLLGSLSIYAFAAGSEENGIMPCYNNVHLTDSSFMVDSNGVAYITVAYSGYTNITTGATITVELQKKFLGLFWTTVDIGMPDNMWVENVSDSNFYKSYSYQLSKKGTYRAEIHYTIYGTAGAADEVEDFLTDTY